MWHGNDSCTLQEKVLAPSLTGLISLMTTSPAQGCRRQRHRSSQANLAAIGADVPDIVNADPGVEVSYLLLSYQALMMISVAGPVVHHSGSESPV